MGKQHRKNKPKNKRQKHHNKGQNSNTNTSNNQKQPQQSGKGQSSHHHQHLPDKPEDLPLQEQLEGQPEEGQATGAEGEKQYESHSDEDYSDTQHERKSDYRKGGYHPVTIGELYNNRYRVVQKLGWGYFSTVWLAYDHEDKDFKAIKIQKSADHYRDAAYDEITLLSQIRDGDPDRVRCCCILTDHFEHQGPNGKHVVMVFEVLGENLLQLITKYDYKGIPIPIVKNIARQVLIGLDYLHRKLQIIHTDVKPENVVVSTPEKAVLKAMAAYVPPTDRYHQLSLAERDPATLTKAQRKKLRKKQKQQQQKKGAPTSSSSTTEKEPADSDKEDSDTPKPTENGPTSSDKKEPEIDEDANKTPEELLHETLLRYSNVKLVDFGNACWTYKHFTDEVNTRQYRAPEVITRNGYDTSVDIWSCACLIFELLTGDFLFDPQESEYIERDEDHLALIVELLQTQPEVPPCLYARGSSEYITSQGYLRHVNHLKFWDLPSVLNEKYKFTRQKAEEIADFLLPMLSIDPSYRATAQQMLHHPWLEPTPEDWDPYERGTVPQPSATSSSPLQFAPGMAPPPGYAIGEGQDPEEEDDDEDEELDDADAEEIRQMRREYILQDPESRQAIMELLKGVPPEMHAAYIDYYLAAATRDHMAVGEGAVDDDDLIVRDASPSSIEDQPNSTGLRSPPRGTDEENVIESPGNDTGSSSLARTGNNTSTSSRPHIHSPTEEDDEDADVEENGGDCRRRRQNDSQDLPPPSSLSSSSTDGPTVEAVSRGTAGSSELPSTPPPNHKTCEMVEPPDELSNRLAEQFATACQVEG